MWNADSSTLPDQNEGRGDEGRLFVFVLIKAFPSFTATFKKTNGLETVLFNL